MNARSDLCLANFMPFRRVAIKNTESSSFLTVKPGFVQSWM